MRLFAALGTRIVVKSSLPAFGMFLVILIVSHNSFSHLCQLTSNGVVTVGHVLELREREHTTIVYSFKSGDKSYTGHGRVGFGNPPFNQLKINDSIIVTYLPNTPEISCSGNAKEQFLELVLMIISLPIVVFAVSLFIFKRRTR
jgi:hypothetical protein